MIDFYAFSDELIKIATQGLHKQATVASTLGGGAGALAGGVHGLVGSKEDWEAKKKELERKK